MNPELDRVYLPERFRVPGGPPDQPATRDVAVLIVAYRNPALLTDCLDSVGKHLPDMPILVWDNSGPGYPGMDEVQAEHSQARWFRGSANVGFAAAVNALAAEVPEHNLLLLNPDAVLQGPLNGTFAALAQRGVAAAAPLVVDANTDQKRYRAWDVAHRRQGVIRALVSRAGYADRMRGSCVSELYGEHPTVVSGYLTGACLAVSRDAWDAVGCFDEEFFLYGEEADWQRRARSAGWSLELVDEPGVLHTGHGTVAGDPDAGLRSRDLLRANIALNLELERGELPAELYLAGTSVLDRVQRSARRQRAARRRPAGARPSVIVTTNRLVFGGAERQHVLLAKELDRRGYEVVIACVQRFGPLVSEIPPSVRVVRQPWWAPLVDVGAGRSIVISGDTNTETGFATVWRGAGRDRRWLVAAHIPPDRHGPTYSRPLAAAMRRADGFIALSPRHWAEATAHQDLGDRRFFAPNGVSTSAEVASAQARPDVGDVPHLVMLSRIVKHKNPHLLIEALDGLRGLPWRLSIYGDGPDREELQAMMPADLGDRVAWCGWSPGPGAALADCDLLCVPSRAEAFPLVILEAMARRIPVAASAVCSVPDMLDGGEAGILVEDISATGWRSALDTALRATGSWKSLGERGFQRMSQLYTVEAMADAYEAAIGEAFE
ncbi:glycosyl transferase family 1 [Mycolicibacterium peregrinum]|uniref:Glycosyl transferase family 1 n=1 Tax=Mycolicibacterium peregrinum TaxID=43304 RepID=A0A1A0QJW1_MYCPR|nr:glycosyltransferase [Mycolicibacterium peregrinum]OBB22193.1 glycosyl transferase family 1 [Mycolicibacterium peregrinum]